MGRRVIRSVMGRTAVVAVLALAPVSVAGQTATPPATQTWNPPRTPDGQPDVQGYWTPRGPTSAPTFPMYTLEDGHLFDKRQIADGGQTLEQWVRASEARSIVVDPPSGRIPYQPWALAKRQEHFDAHTRPTKPEDVDGRARCHLPGVPRMMTSGDSQILQSPGYVVLMNEFTHATRIIPVDGRPHLGENIRLWQGDSRGRWSGNTLTVETTNTNAKWLDIVGNFHSDALRVVERFTLVNADTIRYEASLEDPKVFTAPWTIALSLRRNKEPGFELWEDACVEGQRPLSELLFDAPANPDSALK
jgi:hypothetical protein